VRLTARSSKIAPIGFSCAKIDDGGRQRDVNRNKVKALPNTQYWLRTISTSCHTNSFIAGSCDISFRSPFWIDLPKCVGRRKSISEMDSKSLV
jgi:hypothetical protein